MKQISTEGFERINNVDAGAVPMLQWLRIEDLLVDMTYQRPIHGRGRRNVVRIATAFSWSCFSPVIVSPVEGGKFAIIDGQHRTTAASLVGFDSVPCQVVIAAREQQAIAFKAINGTTVPISPMSLHAAALIARESWAVDLEDVCKRAEVELLRYPVPVERQHPGQTMAVGAIARCMKRYGSETLITALQCITQTANNLPGALTARMIRALCEVLDENRYWRDSGLALLEALDSIDLALIESEISAHSSVKHVSRTKGIIDRLKKELSVLMPEAGAEQAIRIKAADTPMVYSRAE
jgi:hypothetical protein